MGYLLFCDVDEQGNITDALSGVNIIPSRQYDYFFFTMDEGVVEDVSQYKVDLEARQLILKEGVYYGGTNIA
ncbi:hypothetical protein [Neobacillus sp. 19]|uniref:hypothetical protein n=1 Tax=Neobacillus sp. 19 TaxID=3394458 RepID=UPI003BF75D1D